MHPEKKIVCRFPTDQDLTKDRVQNLSDLINAVYDDAESGMWKRQGIRTSPDEVKQLLMEQRLILAEIDGVVVGSVKVDLMGGSIGEFGMLVADVNHRGKGVGSALIRAAEQWAKRMDCATMQLELLAPHRWNHPSKESLKKWYRKIGYEPQSVESFEKLDPDKFAELATDCDFTVWHKRLV